jgi:cytosol alanyl aminopeptidase
VLVQLVGRAGAALALGGGALLGSASGEGVARLGRDVVPAAQSIRLDVDAARREYTGAVRVDLDVRKAVRSFSFHAEGLALQRVALKKKKKEEGAAGEEVPVTHREAGNAQVAVEAAAPLLPGRYVLDVEFENQFDTRANSLYRLETGGHAYTFTQFEADEAREAFPCWDEPSFKIPYQVTLVVPEAHLAISNTPVQSETVKDGRKTVVFKQTPPTPSYLLAMATGPLETVPVPGMSVPGRIVTVKDMSRLAAEAVRVTPPLLAALERYFGRPHPYEKLDVIAVPEFWPGAMENPGAITFRDSLLLLEPGRATASQKRSLATVMAHELAHLWFGDMVTMEWWDDLWLNESFASWMGDKVTQQAFPELNADVQSIEAIQGAMVTDARLSTRAIRQPVTAASNLLQSADNLAYDKGQAVLGMMEGWVGDEAFRRGVLAYLAAHEWKNARAADLWNALSKASGKDVQGPLESFLNQPGVPLVSVELLGTGEVRVSQRRFLNHGVAPPPGRAVWQVPVGLAWSAGGAPTTTTVLLSRPSQTFKLPTKEPLVWVYPNAGERGYYRWHVPRALLTSLAEQAPERLAPRERVGLVGNLRALLDAGDLRGHDYLRLLAAFARDPEPQVLTAVVAGLNRTRVAFVTPDIEAHFATYVRNTLGPALERIGPTPRPGEPDAVAILRPQLLLWLGREGRDPGILAQAVALTASALAAPAAVDHSLASAALQLAARTGDRALFDQFRQRFEAARVPSERQRYLSALAAFEDPALVEEGMRYSLTGPMRPQEILAIPRSQADRHQDAVFRWTTGNYDALAARIPPVILPFLVYLGGGCSTERLEAARAFFTDPKRAVAGTEKELAKMTEAGRDCVALRTREGTGVRAYLEKFPPVG